ncbi:bifunctional diguanylate cyclase/phosphodiesterase [Paenibacillus sp. TRM 82003]|uniref:putative bifunctional diguanylate cyclase/phosphodiesterase n=1 Tax=Kineococcus sp. TRM81007 TaxID=2925831 RepID=UPI001F56CA03|nr:bifunctional diguanylate cyclase/phosphodiesterase [Kineococcus sp. TRM81007]MCI2239858.1 bifunctional diguanylate cyclase/phosphodiesterase [Kineococcus sp. TRM81007]MCI3925838.1 bifunctional diguanylate cyclase/phosphodiesterase [Paenibacillus sp. TRM 82003]
MHGYRAATGPAAAPVSVPRPGATPTGAGSLARHPPRRPPRVGRTPLVLLAAALVGITLTAFAPLPGELAVGVGVLAGASAGAVVGALPGRPAARTRRFPGPDCARAGRRGRAAPRDRLTGLPEREALLAAVDRALVAAAPGGPAPGLLVVDLDRFRDVNDALGHDGGDDVLRALAGRLRALAPADAVVGRLGGDEFAVLVPDGAGAEDLARRVVHSAGRPLDAGGLRVLLPASVGVALAPRHGSVAAALLRSAEAALHEAKRVRGCACTYGGEHAATGAPGAERLRLLGELSRAVERGELFVHYQPQVDPATGALAGAEALVRWRHPDLGTVAPDRFVPLAEGSGLVHALTGVVLGHALADLAGWRACGCDVTVSVNLSARSLAETGLPALVARELDRHGVPARALVLEVTETALVADPQRARTVVGELRALGCSVAVDDYGTGQSSLRRLTGLDVDELKIDRSFVTAMTTDRAREVIVRSTVQMARDLGLRVVAEGVEDAGTLRALAALGCHLVQGTHVGEPAAAGDLLWSLATRGGAAHLGAAPRLVVRRRPSGAL